MTTCRGPKALESVFRDARADDRAVLIPYLTLGYPTLDCSLALACTAIEAGADILELGIPFSDPLADGPAIQHATQTALDRGANVGACLDVAARLRTCHPETPLLFMGYLNPVLAFGPERFCAACRDAGVDGLIVPDLPPEEGDAFESLCRDAGLALVYLLAPNTPEGRARRICHRSEGYVYLVSVTGTTGARDRLPRDLPGFVERVRALTDRPVAVGFGISTPEHAAAVARIADGVIVGSAIVRRCEGETAEADVRSFVSALSEAVRRTTEDDSRA
jgi:tryptophan synthase alpha chain